MGFFTPTSRFVLWLKRYSAGRLIVDAGAGECELSDAMIKAGCATIAIEPYPRCQRSFLLPMRIHEVGLVRKQPTLIVCARPDHSGWVGEIPGYMHDESEMLYIGLRNNVDNDLTDLDYKELSVPDAEFAASLRKQEASSAYSHILNGMSFLERLMS